VVIATIFLRSQLFLNLYLYQRLLLLIVDFNFDLTRCNLLSFKSGLKFLKALVVLRDFLLVLNFRQIFFFDVSHFSKQLFQQFTLTDLAVFYFLNLLNFLADIHVYFCLCKSIYEYCITKLFNFRHDLLRETFPRSLITLEF
jgi:hypothetical protein